MCVWYVMHLLESSPHLLHEVCKDVDIDIFSHLLEDEPVSHAQLGTADGNMLLLKGDIRVVVIIVLVVV